MTIRTTALWLGGALTGISAAGVLWEWLALQATIQFTSEKNAPTGPMPEGRAAILMPLRGSHPINEAAILAALRQDHPDFEVIVGLESGDGETRAFLDALQRQRNDPRLQIAAGPDRLRGSAKIRNLQNALERTDAPLLLLMDADILPEPTLLREMIAPLHSRCGLTTCLFRAAPMGALWSRVDSLWNSTSYLPSALFGRRVIGQRFAFGAAIGIRRAVLEEIGGFDAVASQVGDDYQLADLTVKAGYRVQLVRRVVTEASEPITLRQLIRRRARWARTIRHYQRAGYTGSIITASLPFALLALMAGPRSTRRQCWTAFVLLNRLVCALLCRQRLEGSAAPMDLLLTPIRDILAVYIWFLGFAPIRTVGPQKGR